MDLRQQRVPRHTGNNDDVVDFTAERRLDVLRALDLYLASWRPVGMSEDDAVMMA